MLNKDRQILSEYIPEKAVNKVVELIVSHKELHIKITRERLTKLGDYRKINPYRHQITVNHNLNPYQFLITLLHEIAHFLTYKQYGRSIKPHGKEWKSVFRNLLSDYLTTDIFPPELLPFVVKYAQNPKASTAGDGDLFLKLSEYDVDKNPDTKYIFQLLQGQMFALPNGVVYQLQEKRRTRYKCLRLDNKKVYLIHKNAEVLPIDLNKQNL